MGICAENALAISRRGCVAGCIVSCGNSICKEVQVVSAQSLMSSIKALGMSLSLSESLITLPIKMMNSFIFATKFEISLLEPTIFSSKRTLLLFLLLLLVDC